MKAVLIKTDGTASEVSLDTYEALSKAVGGYIELISLGETGHCAYINEEGKLLGLPVNGRATQLCGKLQVNLLPGDYIVGNMVVVGPPDSEGEETDVDPEFAAKILEAA